MPTVKDVEKAEVLADAAKEDGVVVKKSEKSKVTYWRNKRYSALTILIRGGEDYNGQLGIKHEARFEPFYDTYKGDVVRVGYLKTDRADVAKRCEEDYTCEEITEKEYNLAIEGDGKDVKPLRIAPIPKV